MSSVLISMTYTHKGKEIWGFSFNVHPSTGWTISIAGPRLNIKTVLSTYGDFHVKDKTAVRTSYL